MKILIVKTTSMGDVVHALPAISDIKKHDPQAEIHWLVEASFSGIPLSCPLVDKVISCRVRQWRKNIFSQGTWQEISALKKQLVLEQYDKVIDLQGLIKSAVLARLTKAPICGYDKHSIKEPLASNFYTHRFSVSTSLPAITRCRNLTALSLGYPIPKDEPQFVFKSYEKEMERKVLFFANTSRDSKLWPEAKWIELGRKLTDQGIEILLPWGSNVEQERVCRIAEQIGSEATVPPRKSIQEMIALIGKSYAVVGLDTGMTHLSSAMGIPTVGIFRDYPIELVPLAGNGPKIGLGGVNCCPEVSDVYVALEKVTHVNSESDL